MSFSGISYSKRPWLVLKSRTDIAEHSQRQSTGSHCYCFYAGNQGSPAIEALALHLRLQVSGRETLAPVQSAKLVRGWLFHVRTTRQAEIRSACLVFTTRILYNKRGHVVTTVYLTSDCLYQNLAAIGTGP